jgi:hypothetical protein
MQDKEGQAMFTALNNPMSGGMIPGTHQLKHHLCVIAKLMIVAPLFILALVGRADAMTVPIDDFTLIENATFINVNGGKGDTSASGGGVTITGTPSNAGVILLGSSAGPTPSDPGDGEGWTSTPLVPDNSVVLDFDIPIAAFGVSFLHALLSPPFSPLDSPATLEVFDMQGGAGTLIGRINSSGVEIGERVDFVGIWNSEATIRSAVLSGSSGFFAVDGYAVSLTPVPEPEIINNSLHLNGTDTSYNPSDGRAPAGVFTIEAAFTNISSDPLSNVFFEVVTLTGNNVVLNADSGPGGVDAKVSVPGTVVPGESFEVIFEIGLQQPMRFNFFVDAYGVEVEVTCPCDFTLQANSGIIQPAMPPVAQNNKILVERLECGIGSNYVDLRQWRQYEYGQSIYGSAWLADRVPGYVCTRSWIFSLEGSVIVEHEQSIIIPTGAQVAACRADLLAAVAAFGIECY